MNPQLHISVPKSLNSFAHACLEALKKSDVGQFIALGGAVGLAHYHDYRTTKDVDAWWSYKATEKDKKSVIEVIKTTLENFGEVSIRRFGDVVSIDLRQGKQVSFNFQIATRSALLLPPVKSPWYPIALDSFDDLVASKMTALIVRGAPRDFLDIYEICRQKQRTIPNCWKLWQEREDKRGITDVDLKIGCEALLLHLTRIEKVRPLETIDNVEQRNNAKKVRDWFKHEFCK